MGPIPVPARSSVVLAVLFAIAACHSSATPAPPAASTAPTDSPPVVDASVALLDAGSETPIASIPVAIVEAGSTPADMLRVPGGTFTMGTDTGGEGDERPAHQVTLGAFWLDRTEVTQLAYDACVEAKVCTAPDREILNIFGGLFKAPQKPVIGISWHSARQYCEWRGKRLPREAEFERAVRGDDGRRYPWGNDAPRKELAVYEANYPEEVGSRPLGKGPYGHDDLAGNVWEWLEDEYDPLAYTRATASEGKPGTCDEILAAQNKLRAEGKQGFTGTNPIPTECEKNIRGGAYNYGGPGLRSTNRIHHASRFKLRMTGVRCAKD